MAPGHLLSQAEVLGQQDFFQDSHVLSRSIAEDPEAFHANSVARAQPYYEQQCIITGSHEEEAQEGGIL